MRGFFRIDQIFVPWRCINTLVTSCVFQNLKYETWRILVPWSLCKDTIPHARVLPHWHDIWFHIGICNTLVTSCVFQNMKYETWRTLVSRSSVSRVCGHFWKPCNSVFLLLLHIINGMRLMLNNDRLMRWRKLMRWRHLMRWRRHLMSGSEGEREAAGCFGTFSNDVPGWDEK